MNPVVKDPHIIFEGGWDDLENSGLFNKHVHFTTSPKRIIEITHSDGSIKLFVKAHFERDGCLSRFWGLKNDCYGDYISSYDHNRICHGFGTLDTVRVYSPATRVLKISEALGPHTIAGIAGITAIINSYL